MGYHREAAGALESLTDGNEIGSLEDLVFAVSKAYRKPIVLEGLAPAAWGALTAFLEEDEEAVTIYYRLQDTPQYRLQCICHELGHLMTGTECGLAVDDHVASQVYVSERAIRVHARDLRDTPAERLAEEFAFCSIRYLRSVDRRVSRAAVLFA